ncbi:LOW QUALITY PROTEIN: Kinesin domain-containing protein/Kinesin-related domain-containing protein, partial [Cephalotus follicularis]
MNISTSSIRNLLPKSLSLRQNSNLNPKKPRSFKNSENTPPIDHNIQIISHYHDGVSKPPPSKPLTRSEPAGAPQVPQIKREAIGLDSQGEVPASSDPPVKVVVRIRPGNENERARDQTVRKVSSDTLSVGDRRFTFDSIFDSNSNQEDIFQLVGVPLVKDALAGYNASILSYGQTGSGKTYTMWGPPSAMVEDPSPTSQQGIVPRIFQMLFTKIQREQENSDGKQTNFQCRCSFLEIYNERIGDLLDPIQRNLEIKDDPKNGLYVENLSEEYVTSYEDVNQILIKGLSNRKVGATSINSKSSRSHILFSFVIESWCKGTSSKCFSSSKTSRISFVDLAGSDRNKIDDAGRQCVREGRNVKKSLSRLGHLVNTLAKGTQPGKFDDVLYRGSCLTHLLKESLGGNAKLTVICAISPDKKCEGEILSTLRFGERVKSIRNKPVINEISEDDVNDLSDQIRRLKEELIKANSDACNLQGSRNGYFEGRKVRDNLNQLRVSLNRSLMLPQIDNDSDDEVNDDEDDVKELCQQLEKLHGFEKNSEDLPDTRDSIQFSAVEESFESESDFMSVDETKCPEETDLEDPQNRLSHNDIVTSKDDISVPNTSSCISITACNQSKILQDPTLSESPKIGNTLRKSMLFSSTMSTNQKNFDNSKSDILRESLRQSVQSSLPMSKIIPGPTESLAASLQRGLQIIDYHQRNSTSNRSSVSFSFEHLALKPCAEVDKANVSVQTLPEEHPSSDGPSASLLCASCHKIIDEGVQIDLVEAIKREKELENVCAEQAAKIEQLNLLVDQYKQEGKISSKGLGQQKIPFEDSNNQFDSLKDENKNLKHIENCQPEIIKEKCEIKEVQEVSGHRHGKTFFDIVEKEELLKEIQSLRSKMQLYTDASLNKSTDKLRYSLLSRSIQLRKSVDIKNTSQEELVRERQRWTELESDWISLTDELRVDIESNRQRAEKVEMELREKKCTEELDDALHRSVLGHARMVEHYAELQEKYNDLVGKHRAIMGGIAEVKKAAAKAGSKGHGCSRFAKSLASELSALRVEREREREYLKKENRSLRIQLRDTAEAVHAAGELLVRLREAEQAASVAEDNFTRVEEDNEKLKKQIEKLKRKHKMEMITMKQYLAESRLPESALKPLYRENSDTVNWNTTPDDDQAWRAEFGAIYQEH